MQGPLFRPTPSYITSRSADTIRKCIRLSSACRQSVLYKINFLALRAKCHSAGNRNPTASEPFPKSCLAAKKLCRNKSSTPGTRKRRKTPQQ
jgi:hypothetical protein